MALHRLADKREADPGARAIVFWAQALEYLEDRVVILHVEADAVVAHPQPAARAVPRGANLDARRRHPVGDLDGVVEVVAQRLFQGIAIPADDVTPEVRRQRD